MKILYHHRTRSKDGQFVHIEELTNALKSMGHEIVMVGPTAVAEGEFGSDAGSVDVLKRVLPKFVYEALELGYAFVDYISLRRAARIHRPDCIYERYNLYVPSGVWLHRRTGLPMLLEVNAPLAEERDRYGGLGMPWLARRVERYTWRGADRVLPVTDVLAGHVRAAGVDSQHITVIPNGIDQARLSGVPDTAEAKRRLRLDGRLVLGFVGFMREWHGIERMVDFVADHPEHDAHLLLVGDGPARASVESRVEARGVSQRVTITGVVQRDAVASYIAAFDVALQPQVVAYASPLKLFEYLAMGRAVLAPDAPNIREVLTDGENALLFDPDVDGSDRRALERLCRDPELRARLGRAARETIDRKGLTWSRNAERVCELFRQLGVRG